MTRNLLYFDHNATTAPADEVLHNLGTWAQMWGNPSSIHQSGRGPKSLLRISRQQIASALGVDPLELVFTSSGSESNNTAIKGVFFYNQKKSPNKNHYLFSPVEHPATMKAAKFIAEQGAVVEFLKVNRDGFLDLEDYKNKLTPQTALVSCMMANNETGSLFPILEMTELAHQAGALFHTDAVQALGKMAFSLRDLGVDLASFSSHKFYALRGAGILYSKRGTNFEPLVHGGGQERNRRAGTENILAIASLAAVMPRLQKLNEKLKVMSELRDYFESQITKRLEGVSITAGIAPRLPNTSSLVIDGVDGEILLMNLDMEGAAVSTGAACSSGSQEPSPALLAFGLRRDEAQSSMRFSIGWDTTREQVELFVNKLTTTVEHVRKITPAREQKFGGFL